MEHRIERYEGGSHILNPFGYDVDFVNKVSYIMGVTVTSPVCKKNDEGEHSPHKRRTESPARCLQQMLLP